MIGTSSLRRRAQLLHWRPDLAIVPMRGNVDTRLRKLETDGLDGIVVAAAGLVRMGWETHQRHHSAGDQSPSRGTGSPGSRDA